MRLTALGHSSFILEMHSPQGREVRILGDPWLSDYVIGDVLGRFPRVRFDFSKLPQIDGIYLSHSHTDHLDPYSLVDLWRQLRPPPTILLPESIEYLRPLLEEHLQGVEFLVLRQDLPQDFHGLQVSGLFNLAEHATNEDDVLMLVVNSDRETFLCEADAVIPFRDEHARELISDILGNPARETICFHTTKNELEATMASVRATGVENRRVLVERCREATLDDIDAMYELAPWVANDLWSCPRLIRLVGGQGICFPQKLDTLWNRVLFPIRLGDRVAMERDVAASHGCAHTVAEFDPGFTYELLDGKLVGSQAASYVELLDEESDRDYDGSLEIFENFPESPLYDGERDTEMQEGCILSAMQNRFLPYLIGQRQPSIEHLLSGHGGVYRIRIRYGEAASFEERDYCIRFGRLRFEREDATDDADETYWANDLDDYFEGRCDDFSTFCRHPLPGTATRLWDCFGMPYLNDDLVEKKHRYHFQRAAQGESLEDWVLNLYRE